MRRFVEECRISSGWGRGGFGSIELVEGLEKDEEIIILVARGRRKGTLRLGLQERGDSNWVKTQ